MLGNYLTAAIDIVLYLGTASRHRLLAALYVFAKLFFARVYVGINAVPRLLSISASDIRRVHVRPRPDCPACCSRLRSVEDADRRANSEPDQKPTETTSAVVLHIV